MQTVTVPMESLAELIKLQLDKGGKASLTVTGISMLPMLRNRRDVVVLIPPAELKKGDVILFLRENGSYILHRIIAITDVGFICSGDNQAIREIVTREQVVAVVDSFTRRGKTYGVDTPAYRLYTWACVNLFFARPLYIKLRRCLGRLRRKIRNI